MSVLQEILANKNLKGKQQTEALLSWLNSEEGDISSLVQEASTLKDVAKANCIEAIENLSKEKANICTEDVLLFVISNLSSKTPRVKWESARVVGNCISLHPHLAKNAMEELLKNTSHEGTVVRWSAAFALTEIIKLKLTINKTLIPIAEEIVLKEEKNSIRKMYLNVIHDKKRK